MAMAMLLMTTPAWAGSPIIAVGSGNSTTSTSSVITETVQLNQSPSQEILGESTASFVPEKFVLPQDASVLVVVEGRGGTNCQVYAYEKTANGTDGTGWTYALR